MFSHFRLIKCLHFKDLYAKLGTGDSDDISDASNETPRGLDELIGDEDAAKPELFVSGICQTKRVRFCYNFLIEIDIPMGKFASIFTEEEFKPDTITLERTKRLNDFTTRMTVNDYIYFQNCRSVSFSRIATSKFMVCELS